MGSEENREFTVHLSTYPIASNVGDAFSLAGDPRECMDAAEWPTSLGVYH